MAAATAFGGTALAVGTAGVELTPLPGGRPATAFHVHLDPGKSSTQTVLLHNGNRAAVTFQLYAAGVTKTKSGDFSVADAGTAPWISLPTQQVTLAAGQDRRVTFTVHRTSAQHGSVVYGAVVMALTNSMVVTRAAAMVYLERPGSDPVRRAVVPLVLAAAAIAVGAAAQARLRRPVS